jgi:signal transduction histidine kinase
MGALQAATTSLGGQIEVTSEPHQGTTIKFRFPQRSIGPGTAVSSTKPAAYGTHH